MLNKLARKFFYDNKNINNSVVLIGTGRSGTTWVEDIINCNNDFRIMFEPFNTHYVPLLKNWKHRQYISSKSKNSKYYEDTRKILSGDIKNKWIDRFNSRFFSTKRLIKDIRIHLSLRWIKNTFPHVPIVYLLRHPCAVAKSKESLNWSTDLDVYINQEELVDHILEPFISTIKNANTNFEKHIVLWCIENYVVLSQFKKEEILVCFYESLCTNSNFEAKRLLDYLDIHPNDLDSIIKKPSALSSEHSAIKKGQSNLVNGWQNKVTESELTFFNSTMKTFSLDYLYSGSLHPLVEPDNALMKL
jgi:hypothetical protein